MEKTWEVVINTKEDSMSIKYDTKEDAIKSLYDIYLTLNNNDSYIYLEPPDNRRIFTPWMKGSVFVRGLIIRSADFEKAYLKEN